MEETYLVCEDSMEGIFTGIYEAYACREDKERLHIQIGEEENLRLFAQYKIIEPDSLKTSKVAATVNREFGSDVYMDLCKAMAAQDRDKGEAVFRTILKGLGMKNKKRVLTDLADPNIFKVFELSRNAGFEIHHLKGFLRFQELENGILYSNIGPKNNIVTFLAPHFADRLSNQNFVICDEKRGIFILHPAGRPWYVRQDLEVQRDLSDQYSEQEEEYQRLFTYFCSKIAIESRKNLKLQRNMLPIRFQEYMVEFDKKI